MTEGVWVLHHGYHDGSSLSRDSTFPEEYNTEAEALRAWRNYRKSYRRTGYQIWYAFLASPDGATRILEFNPC